MTHDVKILPKFIKKIKFYSFVIGSRYMVGGKTDIKGWRFFISYIGNKIIKFIFNIKINEFTSSYKAFNLTKLKNIEFNKIKSNGYSFFMEVVYQINRMKYPMHEFPIHAKQRFKGDSKIPKIEIFRTIFNILRLKLKENFIFLK